MKLFTYFNLKFLILGILFGLIAINYADNEKRVIRVYPTPENLDVIQYKDTADNCFRFENIIVDCPNDPSDIKNIPIQ